MIDKWAANISDTSKVTDVPHVSWWQIGNEAVAMSEGPIGIIIHSIKITIMVNAPILSYFFINLKAVVISHVIIKHDNGYHCYNIS